MTKINTLATILLLFVFPCLGQTFVNGAYDAHGAVFHITAPIGSNLTVKNAIIEANPFIQIADATDTFINCKTREFSTAWFGANKNNADNSIQLQKCITTCIANGIKNLFVADSYSYSQSLKAFNFTNGQYIGFGLNIYGDGDRWDDRQTLTYTGSVMAFGVQYAKGGSISKLKIHGNSLSGSGIVVDYDGSKNIGGSTGFFIEEIDVDGFDVLYDISPNGVTYNADIIHFNNIHCGNGRIGIRSNQAQEKDNEINGIYSWGTLHTLIQIGHSGKFQGGSYSINGGNIAGNCYQLFDINLAGWNTFSCQRLFAESLTTMGTITAWNSIYMPPVDLDKLNLRFVPGAQVLFTSNSSKIKISNSAIWFYNGQCCQQMNFTGPFIWDNNDCGSCTINDQQIQYSTPSFKLAARYEFQ